MGNKTKAIKADLGKFTHISEYSGMLNISEYFRIFRNYSGILRHTQNPM